MNFLNVSLIFAMILGASHSTLVESQPKDALCSLASSVPFGCNLYCLLRTLTGLICNLTNCRCSGRLLLVPNLPSLPELPTLPNLLPPSADESKSSSCDLPGKLICNTICSSLLFNGESTCNDEGCFCNGTSIISPPLPNSFTCDEACKGVCELFTSGTGKCIEKSCVCS